MNSDACPVKSATSLIFLHGNQGLEPRLNGQGKAITEIALNLFFRQPSF